MDNYFRYKEKEIMLPVNYMVTREEERHNRGMLIVAESEGAKYITQYGSTVYIGIAMGGPAL